jgi:hypothetical protein
MVLKPINPFHWSFLQILGLIALVFFDLIEWKFCFIDMNVVMGKTLQRPQSHDVKKMWLCGPLFHQEALHMTRCGGNHFLPSYSYLGQWKFCSQSM